MESHKSAVNITAEVTPNPNTLKFNLNRPLVRSGSLNFPDREKAKGSKLAEALFSIENVIGVMVGRDFITVTKAPSSGWQTLVEPVTTTIKRLFESGEVLFPDQAPAAEGEGSSGDIERRIIEILDNEIRPAVNMDGGDITFHGYSDGIVTLHLQGSCSSCPSAIMTLKMGVENRLKSLIPEVREVVQI
jgi:NFU1 iron-sulfur cluster scaffold homolog, mitochondrial